MGQAMTTLFRQLLGEVVGQNWFDRYWKMVQAVLRLLRRLVGGSAGKPRSAENHPSQCCVDTREKEQDEFMNQQEESTSVSDATIGSVGVADEVEEQPRWLGPYGGDKKLLLVGEGDFSFSASLAVAFGDASNMIATSLDSFEFLKENYNRAETNILALTNRGCKVIHEVDATSMAINHHWLRSLKFHCIVFNFPKASFSNPKPPRDAQISKHQELVRGFLGNARKMIHGDGQIHITHQCSGVNLEWNIEMLGSSEGLLLVVEESPFNSREYPGYCAKFGSGGNASFDCNPAKTYKFQLVASPKKKKTRRKKKQLQVEAVL